MASLFMEATENQRAPRIHKMAAALSTAARRRVARARRLPPPCRALRHVSIEDSPDAALSRLHAYGVSSARAAAVLLLRVAHAALPLSRVSRRLPTRQRLYACRVAAAVVVKPAL